jgi:hypothetical protein
MPNLFMVMLGGRHARANTEVHDVVFAVADSLEESYPQLKNAWFGEQKGLHIDAWARLNGVESRGKKYQIQFSDAQPQVTDHRYLCLRTVPFPYQYRHAGTGDVRSGCEFLNLNMADGHCCDCLYFCSTILLDPILREKITHFFMEHW